MTAEIYESLVTNIFAGFREGMFVIDRDFTVCKTNPAFEEMYPECMPLIEKKCFVTSRLDHICEDCPVTEMFTTGRTCKAVHYEPPTETKPERWLEHYAHPIADPSGKVVAALCMINDITQRKENEKALERYTNKSDAHVDERTHNRKHCESLIQAIIAGGSVPVAFADPDGSLVFVNTAFRALTGYSEQELLGKNLLQGMIYDEQTVTDKIFLQERAALCGGEIDQHHQDITIRRKNGELRWVDFSATMVKDLEGNKSQIVFVLLDVTERYQMMRATVDANEQTQIMLDSTPMGCTLFDGNGNVIDCNQEALNLFGMPDKKEYCDRFYELSPEYQPDGIASVEKVKIYIDRARRAGSCRIEWIHRKFDGKLIPCDVTLVRVKRGDEYIFVGYARDIREHKKMLAQMREADERTQIMLDATPLCCNLWDEHCNLIDCNLEAVKLFSLTGKQEYIEQFHELSPEYQPDGSLSRTKSNEYLLTAFRDGHCRFEWMHQGLDGTPIPAEIVLVCVKRGEGYIIAGYTRDLREEKRMLAEMREADERTLIMLDATPLGCSLVDRNCEVVDCNKAALDLFGVSSKQEYRDRFFELMPEYQPDGQISMEGAVKVVQKAYKTGYERIEWMHQTLDGTPIPTEVTLVRVRRGDDDIVAGYTRDLRELKRHEAMLEKNRQRTNALLELAQMSQKPESEIIDYAITLVTQLTDSTMGYAVLLEHAKDLLPFRSWILDQSFQCSLPTTTKVGMPHVLSAVLTECLKTKKAVIHDDLMALPGTRTFPEGHCLVHSHMNFPIMDGDKPVGILGVGNKPTPYIETDIKQLTLIAQGMGNLLNRKKHAENLEKAKNEAEEANKAKSEFLAHMSHEIRTPLNGVIGLSDLLTGTPLNEKQRECVQLISDSGQSLLFLINDILDFSKIEAGKLDIYPEPFDLSATITSVLAALVSRVSGKNLELAVSLCPTLPRIMQGDSGRVRQVLINLAANAVKFTNEGGVRIDVTIESIDEKTLTVRFAVIDTGIGISPSGIERLFKAFSQVDASAARTYGGTGLGLAISMRLVRLMGGNIGVTSVEGKGSTFWVTIPFECDGLVVRCLQNEDCLNQKCPNADGSTCTAFVNREIDAEYSAEGRAVLIVDDNEVQRDALCVQLRNWRMRCEVCGTGQEALRLSEKHREHDDPFDLFVIDSTIADGVGIDLVPQLFEQEYKQNRTKMAQVILLRSISDNFDVNALDAARGEFIGKPVIPSTLFNSVMNRIFALERLRSIDSGTSPSAELDTERVVKPKTSWSPKPAVSLRSVERLKSALAGKFHVLIVEDNRVNQIVAANILAEAGFTNDIVYNGHEACSAVRNKEYDVVLMDCQMPEMDGYEATHLIRNWEREQGRKRLPIIALTANAVKEDVEKCFDAGMDAYCSKPINSSALIHLIEWWYENN